MFVLAEAAACWAALPLPKLFECSAASVRQGLAPWCSSGAVGIRRGTIVCFVADCVAKCMVSAIAAIVRKLGGFLGTGFAFY